jgi:hypothetical protein
LPVVKKVCLFGLRKTNPLESWYILCILYM